MRIVEHRLQPEHDEPVRFQQSPCGGAPLRAPRFLIVHFTAGRSLDASVAWLTQRRARASAHVVIGRDGRVVQLMPFDKVAWHAGRSRWQGLSGLNQHAIGMELDNPGRLVRVGATWRTWFGAEVVASDVVEMSDRGITTGWHSYTEAQIERALEVGALLVEQYRLQDILGHADVSPRRKIDPGPAFPMDSFRALLLGREDDGDEEEVLFTTRPLNIRSGPGTRHTKLDQSPLRQGTRVGILQASGSWRLVDVLDAEGEADVQGWVHSRYLSVSLPQT